MRPHISSFSTISILFSGHAFLSFDFYPRLPHVAEASITLVSCSTACTRIGSLQKHTCNDHIACYALVHINIPYPVLPGGCPTACSDCPWVAAVVGGGRHSCLVALPDTPTCTNADKEQVKQYQSITLYYIPAIIPACGKTNMISSSLKTRLPYMQGLRLDNLDKWTTVYTTDTAFTLTRFGSVISSGTVTKHSVNEAEPIRAETC